MSQNRSVLAGRGPWTFLLSGALWLLLALVILGYYLARPPRIEIVWETATEFQTAGYNVLRGEHEGGPYERINERLIPSRSDAAAGATYSFVDEDVSRGKTYYYRLEDVDFDNSTALHNVLAGQAPSMPGWVATLIVICTLLGLGLLFSGVHARKSS